MVTMALAGDTMLGRLVAERVGADPFSLVIAPEVQAITSNADLCLLNLECCISDRGVPWAAPGKPFFFRAPPRAADLLAWLGADCVTLANNHALDFGVEALADTATQLSRAGIAMVGAGEDEEHARRWHVLASGGLRIGVLGITDHPEDFAAGPQRPGVAFADLRHGVPEWLARSIEHMAGEVDVALVTVHWGPNMTTEPRPYIRAAASRLLAHGATVVVGHSAHVFHGVSGPVLFDLGDFVDDYAVDPRLRNDLGLLFVLTFDRSGPVSLEAVPIALDFCHTRLATGDEAEWIATRFTRACAELGTQVTATDTGRLAIGWR